VSSRAAEGRVVVRTGQPLIHAPPVIPAGKDRRVDLFESILTDIAHPLLIGLPVEAESPGIAKAKREDLATACLADKWIARRHTVLSTGAGIREIDVEAKNFSAECLCVLGLVRRIVGRSAIADTDEQIAARPECEHAAVMIGIDRMWNGQQYAFVRARDVAVARHLILGNDNRGVGLARVVNKE